MLTTCTACGTQFRVSTTQLRSVHGLVRCSRCHSVFDAFETLREEFESTASVPDASAPDDLTALQQEIETAKTSEPAPISIETTAEAPAAADINILIAEKQPAPPMDDLFADLWGEAPAQKPADPPAAVPPAPAELLLIEDHIPKPPELERDQALFRHKHLPPRDRPAPTLPRRYFTLNAWALGSAALILLLGMQLVNANRVALSQSAMIGPSLASVYAALGHPLQPSPQLSSWLVSNINVTSDPDTPGALSIIGSLQNNASFAQPWPVLRVELTDRYGEPLRARDFTASEYLPASQPATWLDSGMATHFRIDVVDPGPDAVGFQVQPCLDVHNVRQCSSNANSS